MNHEKTDSSTRKIYLIPKKEIKMTEKYDIHKILAVYPPKRETTSLSGLLPLKNNRSPISYYKIISWKK
jgi:hypothetical protein